MDCPSFTERVGPKDAPTLLLLHGSFLIPDVSNPSSLGCPIAITLSRRLSGLSDTVAWARPEKFAYTFDHIAETMNHFTEALGLSRYTLYMQPREEGFEHPG